MFVNYEQETQLDDVITNYNYPSDLCIDGGNDNIPILTTFTKVQSELAEFNTMQYKKTLQNLTQKLYFLNLSGNFNIKKKSLTWVVLYYSEENAISPHEVDTWIKTDNNLGQLLISPKSCEFLGSEQLCVVHSVIDDNYNLSGYYYKQNRVYNGRGVYWSMFDVQDDEFRGKIQMFSTNLVAR